jgi:hypothetical protein
MIHFFLGAITGWEGFPPIPLNCSEGRAAPQNSFVSDKTVVSIPTSAGETTFLWAFRQMAAEQLKTCDNIVEFSQELGVHRRPLYKCSWTVSSRSLMVKPDRFIQELNQALGGHRNV